MTIVARFGIQGCPMLMGDLLLSIKDPSASPALIPTAEDLSKVFPAGSTYVPSGLRQKIIVLSDTFALGWAGTRVVARDIIAEVRRKNAATPFTRETLQKHFDALDESVWKKIGLVGFIEDAAGMTSFSCDNTTTFSTPLLGEVALLGSGTAGVRKVLEGIPSLPVGIGGTPNVVDLSVGFSLQLSGVLLNFEMATLQNLNDLYGGGYEIATVLNQKFAKVDDITYLFWQASVDGKGGVRISRLPLKACRYSYHNDILLIRSAKFEDKGDMRAFEQRLFAVSPVYRDPDPGEMKGITPPSFNARFLCNYFLIPMSPKEAAILGMVTCKERAEDEKWVKFEETATEVHAWVETQFVVDVAKEIAKNHQLKM